MGEREGDRREREGDRKVRGEREREPNKLEGPLELKGAPGYLGQLDGGTQIELGRQRVGERGGEIEQLEGPLELKGAPGC